MKKNIAVILTLLLSTSLLFSQAKDIVGFTPNAMTFSKDGKTLYTGNFENFVKVYDYETGKNLKTFRGHDSFIQDLSLSPDGKYLASCAWDFLVIVWDVNTGEQVRQYKGQDRVDAVRYSPDGRFLCAQINNDDAIIVWDASSGSEVKQLRGHSCPVLSLDFTPDGKYLASSSCDGTIKLWDVAKGYEVRSFTGHTDKWIWAISFSPDGKYLASGCADKTAKIWDVESGECVKTMTGHEDKIISIAYSPDGKNIATGGEDMLAKLWDVSTGNCIETYSDHTFYVWSVLFSPDLKYLLTASGDKTVKFRQLKRKGDEIFVTDETKSELSIIVPTTKSSKPDAIAIVIGNKNYKKDIPQVDFALTDANVTKEYLINALGYKEENIIFMTDATLSDFVAAFGSQAEYKGRLYDLIKPGKSDVFIYYSGHGAPDPSSKAAYIVPVDCEPNNVKLNGYSLNTFYSNLAKLDYKTLTVVIDACFSGGSDAGMIIKNASPIFITTETNSQLKKNTVIFTSSKGEQISSWYREKGHSLFTYYFIKALSGEGDENKDGKLSAQEVQKYCDDNVPSTARKLYSRDQNPQVDGDKDIILIDY